MEIFENVLVQLGAVGVMLTGLLFFAKYMIMFFMDRYQEEIKENKRIEMSFRDYLIENAKEMQTLMHQNAETNREIIKVFADNLKINRKMSELIELQMAHLRIKKVNT